MKKLFTVLALVSIASMNAGPYEELYPQSSAQKSNRKYQADDYKAASSNVTAPSSQPIRTESNYVIPSGSQSSSSDQEITKNINASLNTGKYGGGFRDVKFKVNNGNVRLTGSVDTLEYKSKAEFLIKRIDGVREVDNQITISE